MKYVMVVVVLALGASAVSAASAFLRIANAPVSPTESGISILWTIMAGLGMMLTIALRCRSAATEL